MRSEKSTESIKSNSGPSVQPNTPARYSRSKARTACIAESTAVGEAERYIPLTLLK